jgi:hypothetical protein
MHGVLSLLAAACLADRVVGYRNSSSVNSSSNLSSNQSVLKVVSSNHSNLKASNSACAQGWACEQVSNNESAFKVAGTNQSAVKVVNSNQSALKTAKSNQTAVKVAPKKSHEQLQSEVHKLQEENKRLRGLLGNSTQKNTTNVVAASKNATSMDSAARPAAKPSKPAAVPVASSSKKDLHVKPAATASVEAVNHALDAAVRKPAKSKKNSTSAQEATRAKLRAAIKALDRDEDEIAKIEKETEKEDKPKGSAAASSPQKENKKLTPAAHVEVNDNAKDAALEKKAEKVIHLLKDEAKGVSNSTRGKNLLRQLVAPPAETMKPIIKVFKGMIAKLEKLNKHDGDENRMAFCDNIATDLKSCQEPFKDHEGISYKEHSASECLGVRGPMDADLKTDSADECQTKCNDLGPECAGFLHMTSGRDAGMCYFKKGGIKDIETSDKSTCFEKEDPRDPLVKKFVSLNLWVLDQASMEIDWICQSGFRSTREENRVESFRLVIQTYMDGIQCQPGDIPCPGGTISGEKPMCECTKDGK